MALTGLSLAWFRVYRDAQFRMRLALSNRRNGNFGILCGDDRQALEYQCAEARADQACRHLSGPAILSDWSTNGGDRTAESNRDWRRRHRDQKRRALAALKPIWERELAMDLCGA